MAQLVLTVAGSFFGPVGAFVGSAIGSVIDSYLFPQPDQQGPRLSDLKVSTSSYGIAVAIGYGRQNRLPGNLIVSTDLIETAHEEDAGKGKGSKGPTVTTYTYSASFAMAFAEGPGTIKRIWADGKLLLDTPVVSGGSTPLYFDDSGGIAGYTIPQQNCAAIRLYKGTPAQPVDSTLQSIVGAANCPAYRGVVYAVFQTMQLADYGNRIPQITAEIDFGDATVATVVGDICTRVGVTRYDVVSCTDTVQGFVISDNMTGASAVDALMTSYNCIALQDAGAAVFQKRSTPMIGGIDFTEWAGAQENDAMADDPVKVTRRPDTDLPLQVEVSFNDAARDYQSNTQRSLIRVTGNADDIEKVQAPVVMSATQGKQLADSILFQRWTQRNTINSVPFPPAAIALRPGMVVDGYVLGIMQRMRVVKNHRGVNGIAEMDFVFEDLSQLVSYSVGSSGSVPSQSASAVLTTTYWLLDIPLLRAADDDAGFYAAFTAPAGTWRGGALLRSADGVSYSEIARTGMRATAGTCNTTLGSGPTDFIDTVNTVDVTLVDTALTLSSVTDDDLVNGKNVALVGSEVIQFGVATLIGTGQYRLSRLLRGRGGTELEASTHAAAERFIYLSSGLGVERISDEATLLNLSRYYIGATALQDVSAITPITFTNTGIGARPLSPHSVAGVKNSSNNDLAISWQPRTRYPTGWTDGGDSPNSDPDNYVVQIMNGSTVVREINVSSARTVTYTSAQQVADWGSVQSSYTVKVAQLSALIGTAGRFTTATLPTASI